MRLRTRALIIAPILCVLIFIGWLGFSKPHYPVALLQVVDAAGKPVAGAVIMPRGLRTKAGPYQSGWYSWMPRPPDVPTNAPVITDKHGYASVPYPKYVFERLETGVLCVAVSHPDYVASDPECTVATALPAGAPWKDVLADISNRVLHRQLIAHADPIVLQKGAMVELTVVGGPGATAGEAPKLFAQVTSWADFGSNFWTHPQPDMLFTKSLAAGRKAIRAVEFDAQSNVWFSDVTNIDAIVGDTNELTLALYPGVTVRGKLDDSVPRPIVNGRVIAHVWPHGERPQDSPPDWHAWTPIRKDGTFEISSLPHGDLEVIAICDGFINTNGPGKFGFRYPQKHDLGANGLDIIIGMEPTAAVEASVTDEKGKPLQGVEISAWPNARYGEWSAVIVGADTYNTGEQYLSNTKNDFAWQMRNRHDFSGTSDALGIALLRNLPADTKEIAASHEKYALAASDDGSGQKRRQVSLHLTAGTTNHLSLQLEPIDKSPIKHY